MPRPPVSSVSKNVCEVVPDFQPRPQGQRRADAIAKLTQGEQAVAHEDRARGGRVVRNLPRLNDGYTSREVKTQGHDLANAIESLLKILGFVETVPKWASQCRQLQAVGAEQMPQLAFASVAEPFGSQVAGRVQLNAR